MAIKQVVTRKARQEANGGPQSIPHASRHEIRESRFRPLGRAEWLRRYGRVAGTQNGNCRS